MKQDASPAPTPTESTTSVSAPATPTAPDVATITPTSPSPLSVDMAAPPDTANDPFKPPSASPLSGAAGPMAAVPVKSGVTAVPPVQVVGLQPGALPAKGPGGVVIGPAVSTAPAAPATPEVTLQGVVVAEHALGVFRTEAIKRFISA